MGPARPRASPQDQENRTLLPLRCAVDSIGRDGQRPALVDRDQQPQRQQEQWSYREHRGAFTVADMKQALYRARIRGLNLQAVVFEPTRAGDVRSSTADVTRVMKELDWRPACAIDDGLDATIDWYRKRLEA